MVTILKYGSEKDSLSELLERLNKKNRKGIDVNKYAGKIKLVANPVKEQKKLRNEWE